MADDRERNEDMKQGGAQEAPGRNQGTGQEANDKGNLGGQQGDQKKADQEGSYKEGGQNEQTRR